MSHFNNPTVATWYTTQLPCELLISIHNKEVNPTSDTTRGEAMSDKLRKKLFSTTAASPSLPWMNLIPMGTYMYVFMNIYAFASFILSLYYDPVLMF